MPRQRPTQNGPFTTNGEVLRMQCNRKRRKVSAAPERVGQRQRITAALAGNEKAAHLIPHQAFR